jgi:3-oxoacyl-[acyl-carrier protein] reductase
MFHTVVNGNEGVLDFFKTLSPANRVGQPEEVAGVISWLVGPDSSWVSGQNINVNGAGSV